VEVIQTSSNFFLVFVKHHLIERELLIPKNYFLALAEVSFRLKNTKYSKGVVFFKIIHPFQTKKNCLLRSYLQIQRQK